MSQVNIYEKNWLDLVFEGKNKAYGAYQLRQQDGRTTMTALFLGLLFVACLSGLGILLSSFGAKPIPNVLPRELVIEVTDYHNPEPEKPRTELAAPSKPTEESEKKIINDPTIVKESGDDVMTNKEAKENPNPGIENPGTGTGVNPNPGGTEGGTAIVPTVPAGGTGPEKAELLTALDKMPEFPGGIKEFYKYVGNNFKNPELDVDKVTVIMSFVIEKDGKMTDIKALRSPGYGLDKEAIRVLKSLKTEWKPGVKNGQPVRTQYTLPITVKIN